MSRKPLGPPPDWIAGNPPDPTAGQQDPLRSIFNEARANRGGEAEEEKGLFAMVQERTVHLSPEEVTAEIKRRLRDFKNNPGAFSALVIAPSFTSDVPDSRDARLVVLGPGHPHLPEATDSQAGRSAAKLLEHRGAGPRNYRNTLVFLAADQNRLAELQLAVRSNLGWTTVSADARDLHLDPEQLTQAELARHRSEQQVQKLLLQCYRWLLVPTQESGGQPIVWKEFELAADGEPADRASVMLQSEGLLLTNLENAQLRVEMERIKDAVGEKPAITQLADLFAQQLFLPRLRSARVLQDAIQSGLNNAEVPRPVAVPGSPAAPAVKPAARPARRQRLKAAFTLNPLQFSRDANAVNIAVVQHLLALSPTGVKLTLLVESEIPPDASAATIQTITQNCQTLACSSCALEPD